VSADLCGCEFTSLKHKLQRGETLQPDHAANTMLPVQYTSKRERSGTFLLAVVSHLLSVARKFLGGPERIDGDEMKNRRLINEEEKVLLTYTHMQTQ